jgi:hypothetical protein
MFKIFSTMTLFGVLTVSASHAQSNQPIQAHVPFAFTVQTTTLTPGNYQLTYSSSAHTLSIRGLDQNSSGAFATAMPAPAASGPGKLVFNCYNKSCYLAQVWQGATAGGAGLRLPHTGQEHRIAALTRAVSITIPAK